MSAKVVGRQLKAAERLIWAVDTLSVQPHERLLEIGCGHGVAVSLVCDKLDSGSIVAIDRSPVMIQMAKRRNAACVDAGKAVFHTARLHEVDLGHGQFDKIFAIRVGVFTRGEPRRELVVVENHLAPGGRFYLFYDPPSPHAAARVPETLAGVLRKYGWEVIDIVLQEGSATRVACVIAGTPGDRP